MFGECGSILVLKPVNSIRSECPRRRNLPYVSSGSFRNSGNVLCLPRVFRVAGGLMRRKVMSLQTASFSRSRLVTVTFVASIYGRSWSTVPLTSFRSLITFLRSASLIQGLGAIFTMTWRVFVEAVAERPQQTRWVKLRSTCRNRYPGLKPGNKRSHPNRPRGMR